MRRARGRYRPDERPSVGVKHWQGPEIPIRHGHRMMKQRPYHIDISVSVRDHHALWPRSSAAGIIDRQQIGFLDSRPPEVLRRFGDERLIIQPALLLTFQRDEGRYVRDL